MMHPEDHKIVELGTVEKLKKNLINLQCDIHLKENELNRMKSLRDSIIESINLIDVLLNDNP